MDFRPLQDERILFYLESILGGIRTEAELNEGLTEWITPICFVPSCAEAAAICLDPEDHILEPVFNVSQFPIPFFKLYIWSESDSKSLVEFGEW